MTGWERICCAVDGSGPSGAALDHAVELAREGRAALHVLHVRPRSIGAAPFAPPRWFGAGAPPAGDPSEWIARARQALPELVELDREGDPAAEIVRYAREWPADVLVLGTHRRRGLERLVLGSVAHDVVKQAPCPVLVVPERESRARGSAPPAVPPR